MNAALKNIIFITFITIIIIIIPDAWVQAASPTPTPSPSQDPAVTEFEQKVDQIKQEAATQAAQLKSQVSEQIQNKAFIGTASAIQASQLSVQNSKGTTHTVNVDQYTLYQDNTSKKAITFKDLKAGDFLVCLGDVDDNGNLKAKEIIRQKAPSPENKVAVWGQIQSVVINTLSLLKNDGQKATINTSGETSFNLGAQEITLSDLKIGNFVIAVGPQDKNGVEAQFMWLLNKGDVQISSASATPSATPKPSPSKKP